MSAFQAVLYLIGTVSLGCLAFYAWHVSRGKSPLLYGMSLSRDLSAKERLFLGLAALAFFVCLVQGADTMLGWMPSSWGSVDEDGEFQRFSFMLAFVFALGTFYVFGRTIEQSTRREVELDELIKENKHLHGLLEVSLNAEMLDVMKARIESEKGKLDAADAKPQKRFDALTPLDAARATLHSISVDIDRQSARLREAGRFAGARQGAGEDAIRRR